MSICCARWSLNRGVVCLLDEHPEGTDHTNGHYYWPDEEVFE